MTRLVVVLVIPERVLLVEFTWAGYSFAATGIAAYPFEA
jgi:hypothetical protein